MKIIQPINKISVEQEQQGASTDPVKLPESVAIDRLDSSSAIPPNVTSISHTSFDTPNITQGEKMNSDNPNKKRFFIYCGGLITVIFILALVSLLVMKESDVPPQQNLDNNQLPDGSGALGKKLSAEQLSQLNSIDMPFYVPNNLSIENVLIQNNKLTKRTLFTYGYNLQFGRGPAKGSYGFSVYPVSDSFNPPEDCALVGGDKASTPMSCKFFEESEKELPAYIYTGHNPYSIQSTEGGSPIEMYAKKDNVIIVVSTASTEPKDIYEIIKNMKKIRPIDLPENSMISFTEQ